MGCLSSCFKSATSQNESDIQLGQKMRAKAGVAEGKNRLTLNTHTNGWVTKDVLYPPWNSTRCGTRKDSDIVPVNYTDQVAEAMKESWHDNSLRELPEMLNFINAMSDNGHDDTKWSTYLDGYDNMIYQEIDVLTDQVAEKLQQHKETWKNTQIALGMNYVANFSVTANLGTLSNIMSKLNIEEIRYIIHGSKRRAYIDKHLGVDRWCDDKDENGKRDARIKYIRSIILALLQGTLLEANPDMFYVATVTNLDTSVVLNADVTIYEWEKSSKVDTVYLGARARCIIYDLPIWAIATRGASTTTGDIRTNIATSYIARVRENNRTTVKINSNKPEIWRNIATYKLSTPDGESCSKEQAIQVERLCRAANAYENKRDNILMRFQEEITCSHANEGGNPLFQMSPLPLMVALYTSKSGEISDSRWASSTQWGLRNQWESQRNVSMRLCHISEGKSAKLRDRMLETLTLVEYVVGKGRNDVFDIWR